MYREVYRQFSPILFASIILGTVSSLRGDESLEHMQYALLRIRLKQAGILLYCIDWIFVLHFNDFMNVFHTGEEKMLGQDA